LDGGEQTLWERWRGGRESVARDALILKYSSWARLVARDVYMRVHSLGDAWQDCVQNALIGLLEAIDRFDPNRHIKFETYARHRIRGAVFNGLRTLREGRAPGARGDAWARDQAGALAERTQSLDDGSAPDPLDAFVAITVGLGLGFLLDQAAFPGTEAPPDAYAELEKKELQASVTEGLGQLDEREQVILTLHYYHHVPFVDIAARLGVTKGRVSQLHKRALGRLRVILGSRVLAEY